MNRKRGDYSRGLKRNIVNSISHAPDEIRRAKSRLFSDIFFFSKSFARITTSRTIETITAAAPHIVYSKVPLQTQQSVDCHLLTELTEAVELFGVYCIATREAPSRIVLVQKFDNLQNHFLFRNWCSRHAKLMNSLQRWRIIKFLSNVYKTPQVSYTSFFIRFSFFNRKGERDFYSRLFFLKEITLTN